MWVVPTAGCPNLSFGLPQSQPSSVLALLCGRQRREKPVMNTYLHPNDDCDCDDEVFDDCEVLIQFPLWIPSYPWKNAFLRVYMYIHCILLQD